MKKSQLIDLGVLILRAGLSITMLTHGISKAEILFDGQGSGFADPIGIGPLFSLILITVAELLCAALVLLGVRTRITAVPVVIAMFIAVFFVHGNDPWAAKELATVYMIGFASLIFLGSGNYSVDRILKK